MDESCHFQEILKKLKRFEYYNVIKSLKIIFKEKVWKLEPGSEFPIMRKRTDGRHCLTNGLRDSEKNVVLFESLDNRTVEVYTPSYQNKPQVLCVIGYEYVFQRVKGDKISELW